MPAEKNFENKIKRHIEQSGGYWVKFFANRMTKVGIPDLLTCVNGYFLAIEVKSQVGTPSDLQRYNVNKINESGGFAVIVRPTNFEDLKTLVEYLRDDQTCNARVVVDQINHKFF